MVDAGAIPSLPTSPAAGSLRARVVESLHEAGFEPALEQDADLSVIVQEQRLFVHCMDTVPPLVRVCGQWLLDDSVGGDELDRLRAANRVTGGANLVKVTLHDDRLVIAIDLVVGADVELTSLLAASIDVVLGSVHRWHEALAEPLRARRHSVLTGRARSRSVFKAQGRAEEDGMADANEQVRLEVDGGIGTIRLDRPPMNALNSMVQDAIRDAAQQAASDPQVAAVVVYGGERVFAAGADIKQMQAMSYTDMVERSGALQAAFTAVAQIPKPTVAAVTGYALGGGCELALCCDFRVAADDAKLGQPEVLLGVIPGAGGTQRLARLLGPARAKDLIFSGRFVDAAEALAIGLVDEVVPAAEVYAAARRRLERYVGGPAYALRAAKEAIDRGLDADLGTGLQIERMLFAGLFATRDREIGMASFVAEGPGKARFEGR